MISTKIISKISILAIITILSASAFADTTLGPSTIPANVVSVSPEPDTRVNLAPTEYPMGIQQISILFNKAVSVNTDCDAKACIYLIGDDTPLQTVGVSGASIGFSKKTIGCILFPFSCKANGSYRMTIPEGFWILNDSNQSKSKAMELYYEIYNPQKIYPQESVYKEISEFRLYFPDYQEATLINPLKIELFKYSMSESDICPITATVGTNDDGSPSNYIVITPDEPITSDAEYSLFFRAGAAGGIYYEVTGEGQETVFVEPNIEAIYRYTVSQLDTPPIIPEQGPLDAFTTFEITVPDGADFWFVNDKAINYIYKLNEDGTFSEDNYYRLVGRRIGDSNKILLTILENGEKVEAVYPMAGEYVLKLANGLFSGSWNGEFLNSAPFIYYYDATGNQVGIEQVSINENTNLIKGIYTIEGKKIAEDADEMTIKALPKGIYIIDGKKRYTHF